MRSAKRAVSTILHRSAVGNRPAFSIINHLPFLKPRPFNHVLLTLALIKIWWRWITFVLAVYLSSFFFLIGETRGRIIRARTKESIVVNDFDHFFVSASTYFFFSSSWNRILCVLNTLNNSEIDEKQNYLQKIYNDPIRLGINACTYC